MMAQEVAQDAAEVVRAYAPKDTVFTILRRFVRKRPLGAAAGVVVITLAAAALFADYVTPYGPYERDVDYILGSPSLGHPFGTDQLGRDTLTRVIYGARLSLFIGLAISFTSATAGLTVGTIGGFFGGKVDRVVVMLVDAVMSFPTLILAIALVSALGQSVMSVILAVLLPFSARMSRIVRANVLTVRSMPYVEAGRSVGAGSMRLILRYIVPNVMAVVIVLASLNFAVAMLVEGSLSFLGLGPPPPAPSWGRMLADEGRQFFRSAPWLGIWPGATLALGVFAFNLLGDGLRDHLDPRLRER